MEEGREERERGKERGWRRGREDGGEGGREEGGEGKREDGGEGGRREEMERGKEKGGGREGAGSNLWIVRPSLVLGVRMAIICAQSVRQNFGSSYF